MRGCSVVTSLDTRIGGLTSASNSRFRKSDTLFWPLQALHSCTQAYTLTHTHTHTIKNFTFLKKIETDDVSWRKQISYASGSPPVTFRRNRAPWHSEDVAKQCPDTFQLLFCCCSTGNKVFLPDAVRKSQNHVQPSRFGVASCRTKNTISLPDV